MPSGLVLDWHAPWLAGYAELGQSVQGHWQRRHAVQAAGDAAEGAAALSDALNHSLHPVLPDLPVRFVPQSALPPGQAYEQFIYDTLSVPTRDNLHDFFNALVWARFPQTKRQLNRLQAQAIAADGVHGVRGRLRDALTVFDENGAVLHAHPALWQALQARDWQRLFVDLRPLWSEARLVIFGHALLEKLVAPRKPMVAHVYQGLAPAGSAADLDGWMSAQLQAPEHWATKPFVPLPVLGVPQWWAANAEPGFYDDVQVFRPARTAVTSCP